MTVSQVFNASDEAAAANNYPNIRVFTVGQGTNSTTPLVQLKTIEQAWAVASSTSIGGPQWGYFSASCWFFGRTVFDGLGGKVHRQY
jgi:sialate O-acetylesterase